MAKKDLVLAAAGGYSWDKIDVWALSLVKSGFQGIGAVIIYDDPANISEINQKNIDNLKNIGFQVVVMPLRGTVFNQRFFDFHEIMQGALKDLRYAVITDIRDVYFQSNPIDWLEANLSKSLYACSESLRYKDESWNADNLVKGFPFQAPYLMNNPVYNVGVLAGKAKAVADITLGIGMAAKSSGFNVADQSGYNVLLSMDAFAKSVQFGKSEDGFACQAGTTGDPTKIERFRPNLLEPEPILDAEGVKTSGGLLYPIVHQYDRAPLWDTQLRNSLNEKLRAS
jgi:hypothetical protein